MIARAITAIIGVVIGLFATFAVFSAILGGLDNFYLLTQDACNYGSHNSPKRALRIAPENSEHPRNADEIDWTRDGLDLVAGDDGSCVVDGSYDAQQNYLTPTGDAFTPDGAPSFRQHAEVRLMEDIDLPTGAVHGGFARSGHLGIYLQGATVPAASSVAHVFIWNDSTRTETFALDRTYQYGHGVWYDSSSNRMYALRLRSNVLDTVSVLNNPGTVTSSLTLDAGTENTGLHFDDDHSHFYTLDTVDYELYRYDYSDGTYEKWALPESLDSATSVGVAITDDDNLLLYDSDFDTLYVAGDYRGGSGNFVRLDVAPTNVDLFPDLHYESDGRVHMVGFRADHVRGLNHLHRYEFEWSMAGGGGGYDWIEAEDVFTAQEQLVTLLAVIAAIGMPIGAMTAIVFFGQAVLSSGMTGQGASQVLVAIAAVVIILVSIQMFQQFAGFLGTAFDAVNGDRFVVFDETLGSLAETIAEFWGVLAFAGFINIATIVWRNYSGNFSIGGNQGGL